MTTRKAMGFPPRRNTAQSSVPRSAPHTSLCPTDLKCSCHSSGSRRTPLRRPSAVAMVHADTCRDLDCHDVEQIQALQLLDHFTDYDHYERCCDGHHHGVRTKDERCLKTEGSHYPTTESCTDCVDDCDDCAEEHQDCYDEVDVCDDDCEQCEVECEQQGHEPADCPRDHPTTRDNCVPRCQADSIPLPQLGPTNEFDLHAMSSMTQDTTPCTMDCSVPTPETWRFNESTSMVNVFDSDMDHWQTFVQAHHCAPDPCLVGQPPQFQQPPHIEPSFGFTFGCDPINPANQYPWQKALPTCNIPSDHHDTTSNPTPAPRTSRSGPTIPMASKPPQNAESNASPTNASDLPMKTCEWIMPCNSICGATFVRTEDLKKHIKNSHTTKGTVKCSWKSCSASFKTEAALTGHISKKHLTVSDEEGPWKCTFAGCTKSFMYKQVRDDHLASHNGGNKMHCPVCHQWLNCEGSNFRRHMASHGPKNEYFRCQYENFGCKKRFPRLDNLRRHEACCKFGKKAAGVHHHHHRVHVRHDA